MQIQNETYTEVIIGKRKRGKEKEKSSKRVRAISHWEELPIELKDMIFSYLKVNEIAIFLFLSKEDGPLVYSYLDKHFKNREFYQNWLGKSSEDFLRWVVLYPGRSVTHLCFQNEFGFDFLEKLAHWHNLENLEALDLSLCIIPEGTFTARLVDEVLVKAKKLKILNLSYENLVLEDKVVEGIALACPNLEEIHFRDAAQLTNKGFSAIAKSCQNLKILDLNGCRSIVGIKVLDDLILNGHTKLTFINLILCDFESNSHETKTEIFKNCPDLKFLGMS